jgi:hypothetical protein
VRHRQVLDAWAKRACWFPQCPDQAGAGTSRKAERNGGSNTARVMWRLRATQSSGPASTDTPRAPGPGVEGLAPQGVSIYMDCSPLPVDLLGRLSTGPLAPGWERSSCASPPVELRVSPGAQFVQDEAMPVSVSLQTVHPRKLAAVRRERARSVRRGVRPWTRCGNSSATSRGCGRTATMFSFTTTRRGLASRCCAISVSRSRAQLNPWARCTRPRHKVAKPPLPSTVARTTVCRRRTKRFDSGLWQTEGSPPGSHGRSTAITRRIHPALRQRSLTC